MYNYGRLVARWQEILDKVEKNNGTVYPIQIGEKATFQEIEEKEKELGCKLPASYRDVVQNFAKSLYFHYSFSDNTVLPDEFGEIFSGEIWWDFSNLEDLNELADNLAENENDYSCTLRDKLQFSRASNGDIYAFDMAVKGEEKPVVYWEHETDTVTYIADSFIVYLEKITQLNCIGSEIWQIQYFLNERGLDVSSPKTKRWREWFDSFSETSLEDVKGNLDELIAFTVYRKKLDAQTLSVFRSLNKRKLFASLVKSLEKYKSFRDQKIVCEIIGETLGAYAEDWVLELWRDNSELLDARLRSYLSAKCIGNDYGLELVLSHLEKEANGKITGYDALFHLSPFQSERVISWMEQHISFPVTEGWSELFIKAGPCWEDIQRWAKLDERYQATLIHALEYIVNRKVDGDEEVKKITLRNMPSKEILKGLLVTLNEKQILRKRKNAIQRVLEHIDVFY